MKKRMLFVFNPKAGKGRIKTHLLDIVDIFNKGGYEVIIRATQGPKDAYEQVKEYADQVDLIACSGGDGTLDEVVTGIVEVGSQTPIGYIPAGSTNDFANSLFMPKSMTAAASMIMEEQIYHCDIGKFNNQTFAYVAAFGLFTNVSYETDQDLKNILGHVAYVLEGMKQLFEVKSYHLKVTSEELTVENVRKYKRFHPRCGTSFIFLTLAISILVYTLLPINSELFIEAFGVSKFIGDMLRVCCKIIFLPIVVGISYELIRIAGKYDNVLTKIISAPGLAIQRLTTKEPADEMIEVAIASMKPVLPENAEDAKW